MSLRRGAALTVAVTYAGMALSLVSTPLVARSLGPEGRGELAACFAAAQTVEFVAFLGVPRGAALVAERSRRVALSVIGVLTGLGLLMSLALVAFALLWTNESQRVLWGSIAVALSLVLTGTGQLGGQLALLDGRLLHFNLYRAWPLLVPSLAIIVGYGLGRLTFETVYVSMLASSVLSAVIGIVLIMRAVAWDSASVPWRLSLRYWSAVALDSMARRLDLLVGAAVLSAGSFGVYAVATTLAMAAGGLAQAFNAASLSKFVQAQRRSQELPQRHVQTRYALSLLSAAVVAIATVTLWEPLFGTEFAGLASIAVILCAAQIGKDSWNWLVETETIAKPSHLLNAATLGGLAAMGVTIAVLSTGEDLNGQELAISVLAFSFTRILLRNVWRRLEVKGRTALCAR